MLTENDKDRDESIQQVTSHIPSLVTIDQNSMFMRPTTLQEVEIAIKQMKEDKAPMPNNFTVDFFHFYWDLLKHEIWEVVEES